MTKVSAAFRGLFDSPAEAQSRSRFLSKLEAVLDEFEADSGRNGGDSIRPTKLPATTLPEVDDLVAAWCFVVKSSLRLGGAVAIRATALGDLFPRVRPENLTALKACLDVDGTRKAVGELYGAIRRLRDSSPELDRDSFKQVLEDVRDFGKMLRVLTWSEQRLKATASTQREVRFVVSGPSEDVAAAAAAILRAGELALAKEMLCLAERHGWAPRLGGCGGMTFQPPCADSTQQSHVHFEHVDWPTLLLDFGSSRGAQRSGAARGEGEPKSGGADDYWDEARKCQEDDEDDVEDGHMRTFNALGLDESACLSERGEDMLSALGGMGADLAGEGC